MKKKRKEKKMSDVEVGDIEELPKKRGRPRKVVAEEPQEAPPEPAKRGRPRKVVAEEPQEAPPEPPKRGRPRKVVIEEPPQTPEPPPRRAKKHPRDPSEMEPAQVSFSSARGERSFAAQRPRRTPQPEPPVEEVPAERAPQPGPFRAMHHRPVSARQAAMENLMAGW